MSDNTAEIIEGDTYNVPAGERFRIVYDNDPMRPYGDILAPCWQIDGRTDRAELASDYDPPDLDADTITTAVKHYGTHGRNMANVARYLRIFHGATAVEWIDVGRDVYMIADTPAWREHVGITELPAQIDSEIAEWSAYVDGDVFGVIRERHRSGRIEWNTGESDDIEEWEEIDACWGFFGRDSALSHIRAETS